MRGFVLGESLWNGIAGADSESASAGAMYAAGILMDAAAKGTVLLLVTCFVAGVLLRGKRAGSAAVRHCVWASGMMGLLILPVLALVLPGWGILPVWTARQAPDHGTELAKAEVPGVSPAIGEGVEQLPEGAVATGVTPAAASEGAAAINPGAAGAHNAPPVEDNTRAQSTNWIAIILWVWGIGAGVALLPLALSPLAVKRLRRGISVEDATWTDMLQQLRASLGIRRHVGLLQSDVCEIPMAFGILRPEIVLPMDAAEWPETRRRMVLLHELAHIRRHDCLIHLLTRIVRSLYWFHPLAWLAAARVQAECERACDDLVLAAGAKSSDYATTLMDFAAPSGPAARVPLAALAMARPSAMEGRLLAVLDRRRNCRRLTVGMLTSVIAGVLACTVPLAMMQARAAEPLDPEVAVGNTVPPAPPAAPVTLPIVAATIPATASPIPAASLQGKKITLTINNQPLRQALEEFEKQTGLRVQVHAQEADTGDLHEKLVTLDAKDKPIWEVLQGLLKQVQSDSNVNFSVGVVPHADSKERVAGKPLIVGPFMLVAGPVVPDQGNLRKMPMRVLKDPSLNVWRVSFRPKPARAVDDQRNDLVPIQAVPNQFTSFGVGFDYLSFPESSVLLRTPSPDVVRGRSLTLIEGVLQARISDIETIEIPKGATVEKRFGKIKFTFTWGPAADIVAANPNVAYSRRAGGDPPYALVKRWEPDESISLEEWNEWRNQNIAGPGKSELFDAAGKPLVAQGGSSSGSGPPTRSTVGIGWFGHGSGANAAGEPVKAVVQISMNARTIEIPYRFENIALP